MVPVPEEHVQAVMQFVLRAIARATAQDWDNDSVAELWEGIDESSRSVIAFVARAAAADVELDIVEAARKLQITPRETTAIINELTNTARESNRPSLITTRVVNERLPNGRTTEKRVLQMDPDLAAVIRDTERAELLDVGTLPTGTDE
jgi:hypothetical protein